MKNILGEGLEFQWCHDCEIYRPDYQDCLCNNVSKNDLEKYGKVASYDYDNKGLKNRETRLDHIVPLKSEEQIKLESELGWYDRGREFFELKKKYKEEHGNNNMV